MSVGSAILPAGLIALGHGIHIPAVPNVILLTIPVVLSWSRFTVKSFIISLICSVFLSFQGSWSIADVIVETTETVDCRLGSCTQKGDEGLMLVFLKSEFQHEIRGNGIRNCFVFTVAGGMYRPEIILGSDMLPKASDEVSFLAISVETEPAMGIMELPQMIHEVQRGEDVAGISSKGVQVGSSLASVSIQDGPSIEDYYVAWSR